MIPGWIGIQQAVYWPHFLRADSKRTLDFGLVDLALGLDSAMEASKAFWYISSVLEEVLTTDDLWAWDTLGLQKEAKEKQTPEG